MFLNEPHVRVSSRLAYPQCGHEGRVVHEILGVLSESLIVNGVSRCLQSYLDCPVLCDVVVALQQELGFMYVLYSES